ncbi:MAG: ABC transporter substrate-binding protein [Thermomicrobiaceae bacterium]
MSQQVWSRRAVLKTIGLGAGAVLMGSLIAACESEDTGDSGPSSDASDDQPDDAEDEPSELEKETPKPDDESAGEEDEAESTPEEQHDDESTAGERPELVVAVQGLPETLDPYQHLSNLGTRVTYSLYDHLLERQFRDGDPPGTGAEIGPMLAESWERIDDLTLELQLREDVLFHDGSPMTAEDVKFTFERSLFDTPEEILDAEGYISTISEIEVVDDYTIRLHTEEPDPLLDMRLTSWATWILPKAYYESVGIEGFALDPIGTGPYRFAELQPDNELVLEAFDDYWGGTPPVSRVTFRVIPEVSSRVAAVASGEVDIATNIPPDQVGTLEDSDGVSVQTVPLANVHLLRYNVDYEPLDDQRLRQAMNLAIDRELLVETLWSGMADVPRGHQFPEYGDMYNPDRPIPEYDPERARELVEESDYDGEAIVFRVSPFYYTNGLESAQAIIEMWAEIGLNAEVEVRDNPYDEGPEEIMVTNWSNSSFVADPDGALWLRWGADYPGTQEFFWFPEDERFNELGAEARTTMDEEFRYEAYQTMLDIWEEEAPGTVLYIPHEIYGVRDGIEWTPYSFYYMDLRPENLSVSK